jgi:MFS transporter, DHA1 family, multidrug resistance protein
LHLHRHPGHRTTVPAVTCVHQTCRCGGAEGRHPAMTAAETGASGPVPTVGLARLVILLGALTACTPFAIDMYLAGIPDMVASFRTDPGNVQLGLSMFFVGLALGQLLYGPVIDRVGRKAPLLAGLSLFVATSVLLALTSEVGSFIGLRFVQGIGCCSGMIIGRAVINDLFEERDVARVMSLMMLVLGMAPVVAPMIGGFIVSVADWRMIFAFLTLYGAICFAAAYLLLPETLPPLERQVGSLASVFATYGRLLATRAFLVPTLGLSFAFGAIFAFVSGAPFVYMGVYGATPQEFGWLFGLNALSMIISSQSNRWLLTRFTTRQVLVAASSVSVIAAIAAVLLSRSSSIFFLIPALFFCLGMMPMIGANATAIAMQAARPNSGSGSAVIGVMQFGFAALVSSIIGLFVIDTPYPMTGTILVCASTAWAIFFFGLRRR